jgi:acetylglutamate synthase
MIINIKEKFMQIMPETAPEMLMNFLRTLKDDDFIINVSASSDDQTTTTTQSAAINNNMVDETNPLLYEFYPIVVRSTNLLEVDFKKC